MVAKDDVVVVDDDDTAAIAAAAAATDAVASLPTRPLHKLSDHNH